MSTGGRVGTLLVTAELAEEIKSEFGTRDITFSVWNPVEMEQPVQTFSQEVMMGVATEFHNVVDADFDGFQDFRYLFHRGNQPNYWLWDEEQAQFVYYAPLIEVSSPGFDADRQIVTGWARSSAVSGTKTFYRWIDGELVLVREIDHDFGSPGESETEADHPQTGGDMFEIHTVTPYPDDDFSGKAVIPFVTHGTGGMVGTIQDMTANLPDSAAI